MEQPPPYNKVNPRQQTSNVAAIYDSPLDVKEHEYTYVDPDAKRMDSIEMRSLGEPSVNDGENRTSSTKCSKRVCCIVTVAIFILVILAAGGYGVFFILNQEKGAAIVCPYTGENDTASISFSRPSISDFDDEVSITYTLQTGEVLAIFPFSKPIHTLHNMEEGVTVITATGSDGSKTASCDFTYFRIPVNENSVVCSPACVNGGECTSPDTCDCATGYAGDICQIGVCTPTCMNGGTCVGPNTCQCVFGFIGLQCETEIVCSSPCLNGGTCSEPNTCRCASGFTGSQCQTALCDPQCLNGGTCTSLDTCACVTGFSGAICQNTGDQTVTCFPPCMNEGICTAPNTCSCTTSYSGNYCQTLNPQTALCDPQCLNGGTCTSPNNCACFTGYSGAICQNIGGQTVTCSPQCLNGGICTATNTCGCVTGYSGNYCQTLDPQSSLCDPQCLNGGTCTSRDTCACVTGYSGAICQNTGGQTVTCGPQCLNGGICTATNTCACVTGYSGNYCQTVDDQTAPSSTIAVSLTFIFIDNQLAVFTAALLDQSSQEYRRLVNQLTPILQVSLCNLVPGCNEAVITGFGPGSIVVNSMLLFAPGSTSTSADIAGVLSNGLGIAGYEIDPAITQFTTCNPGCENGGVCSGPNTCDCTGTGYKGSQCQITVVCTQPCLNGGSCTDDDTCTCAPDYEGSQCQNESGLSAENIVIIIAVFVVVILIIMILVGVLVYIYKSRQQQPQQYLFDNQYNMSEYFMPGDFRQIRFSPTLNEYMQTRALPPQYSNTAVGSNGGFIMPYMA